MTKELHDALLALSLPAAEQLKMYPVPDGAASELSRRYHSAYNSAMANGDRIWPPLLKQGLDELLTEFSLVNPLMYASRPVDC